MRLIGFLLSILLLVAGCALFPAQFLRDIQDTSQHDGELIFSHERHSKMTIECTACHRAVLASQQTGDNLLPQKADCMQCHKPTQQCRLCHQDVSRAIQLQPRAYRLRFSHEKHQETACVTCHASMASSRRVSDPFLPVASTCRRCHEIEESTCQTCHETLRQPAVLPVSHDGTWLERHENQTAEADQMCEQCHRGATRAEAKMPVEHDDVGICADCHRGDIWPATVHDNNYLQSHTIDARFATNTCYSCHQHEECVACHESQGFSFVSVHPQNWQFRHGDEARRQLTACTTCHVEPDCLGCHQTLSPHPSDWDRDVGAHNEDVCRKCHLGTIPD